MKFSPGLLITIFGALLLNGCSVLIGNVKPVEEKAETPKSVSNTILSPNWKKIQLKSSGDLPPGETEDTPDAAWQSTKTAAVISLNSACRHFTDDESNLKEVTRSIMNPWRDLKLVSQKETMVSGYPALETTAEGIYLNRQRKFQLAVVKSPTCIYDLIFLSPVHSFGQEIEEFQRFRDTLKLK